MCLQGSGSDISYSFANGSNREHHDISHDSDETGFRLHTGINRWAIDRVAQFAAELDAIPEGDGTMLDNSIVAISYELGKGRGHDHDNVAHVIFGSAGGYYKTNNYVKLDNREVNDLLLTHVRACGIGQNKVSKVGYDQFNSGVINELVGLASTLDVQVFDEPSGSVSEARARERSDVDRALSGVDQFCHRFGDAERLHHPTAGERVRLEQVRKPCRPHPRSRCNPA